MAPGLQELDRVILSQRGKMVLVKKLSGLIVRGRGAIVSLPMISCGTA